VGAEFRRLFIDAEPGSARFFVAARRPDHFRFDLEAYVAARLSLAGIDKVERLSTCTYPPENGFFSFRRTTHLGEPDYGRAISAIMLG
jgi:copper oxidase (laccase) domain-containing protein